VAALAAAAELGVMNMKNIDEISELTEEVSRLSEELNVLKIDYQETKDRFTHVRSK
jgi:chromosome segregation ATPase